VALERLTQVHRFQWAASHLRCLAAYCTDYDISEALKELPQGLDKTYEHMIKQLTSSTPTRNMRLCRRVFQMLLFAHRPLTLPELAVAISIEPESKNLDTSTILNDPQSVLALGGPLVVYQPETNLVQFSHHTVREYLVSLGADAGAFHFIQADSHAEITRTCLCYIQSTPVLERLRTMSFSDLQAGESGGEGDVAFVHYAAKYWIGHAQQTTTTVGKDMLANLLYNFFFAPSQERPFHVWQAVAEPPWDAWEKGRQPARLVAELTQRAAASAPMAMMPAMSALGNLLMARQRAAASATAPLHLQRHWERLPKINFLPSSAGGERRIAPLHQFHYLARINHPECLSRILSYGGPILGRITATGGPLATTTLDEAAKHGALEFLEVLFNAWNGQVDVNSTDMLGRTALFYASQSGSVGVVQLLLQHGAEVIRSDWYGSTPFHEAVIRGHHAVVECLLSASKANLAVLDFVDLSDETPLAKAGRSSDSEMVRLLVRHCSGHAILGAVRAFLRSGTSPGVLQTIMGACSERTWDTGEAPLQELVQEGAERHLYGVHPGNPTRLHVLNMLVDNGYPVDLEDSKRDTALGYALDDGQENMSLALLDRGAQLPKALRGDLSPRRMGAAFIKAVDRGGFKLALLLLSRGAAWDVEDQWGRGFIDVWAAQVTVARPEYVPGYAPLGIVEATTATSAVEDPIGTAALQLLKGVLERGMDINATNAQGRSLLHLLCSSLCGWNGEGIPELRWILSRGGNASLRDNQSMTPLHCLCANAQARWTEELGRVVGLLTEPVKNSINACVLSSGTPLHMLVESSFGSGRLPDFVMYALDQLLEAGASREAWNSRGETPLVIALAALLKDPQWSRRNSHGLLSAASRLASPDKEENRLPSDSGDQIIQGLLATFGGDDLSLAFLLGNLNLTPPQTVLALGRTTNIRALEILIEGGANVRCRDDSGRTPLHMQVWRRGENLCGRLKVLLEAGADPNALDKGGKSVMDMLRGTISEARARGVGKTDVEELLLRYGARKLEIKVEASHGGWTRVDGRWVKTD
jgi:ankyrin repeat protein